MATEILWINHAGYELRTGGLRIVHDPWIDGLAFDNGWALLAESVYKPDDFVGVDYIWFSHEHPDHFSPGVLKAIPEAARKDITVLFQRTLDRRVAAFCERAGFRVIELDDGVNTPLNDVVSVTCGQVVGRDSWLFVESDDCTIFNANDCVGCDWKKIASGLRRPLDILMTQFSYANWVGNPGEDAQMRKAAQQKFEEMESQISAFTPKYLVPFASFIWFCREENFHMNSFANSAADVVKRYSDNLPTIVLYPGDRYVIGQEHSNQSALKRYDVDQRRHKKPIVIDENSVELSALIDLANSEQHRLRNKNQLWLLKPLKLFGVIKPVRIFLSDIRQGMVYSMFGGITQTGIALEDCEIVMKSTSFALMLKTGYGYGTLMVNGRYLEKVLGAAARLSRNFAVSARNEEGYSIPSIIFNRPYMLAKLRQTLKLT